MEHTARYFLKKAGYREIFDRRSGKTSYAKPLAGKDYPRFHIYMEDAGEKTLFNLHLDIKKPSYAGVAAHSGEYDSKPVKTEAERIMALAPEKKPPGATASDPKTKPPKNKTLKQKLLFWKN